MESFDTFNTLEREIRDIYIAYNQKERELPKAKAKLDKLNRELARLQDKRTRTKSSILNNQLFAKDMDELLDKIKVAKLEYDLLDSFVNSARSCVHLVFNRKRRYDKERQVKA